MIYIFKKKRMQVNTGKPPSNIHYLKWSVDILDYVTHMPYLCGRGLLEADVIWVHMI